MSKNHRTLLIWAAILAVYAGLALAGLSHQDLDQDELITSRTIRQLPFLQFIINRFQEGHPPLYFLLAKTWLAVFGHTALNLYLLSVTIGAAAIIAMGGLARELGLGRWSLVAAFLWAIHPTLQFYARYARPMIGVILFSTLVIWVTAVAMRKGTRQSWIILLVTGLLGGIWNHMIALAWVGLAVAVVLNPNWRRHKQFWFALALILVTHLCSLLGVVWASSYDNDPMEWIQPPAGFGYIEPYLDVLGGWPAKAPGLKILSAIVLGSIVAGLVEIHRRRKTDDPWRFVAAASIVPAAAYIAGTCLIKPMLIPRYMVVMVAPAFLLLMWLLSRAKTPNTKRLLAACLAGLTISGTPANIERHDNGLRETVRRLNKDIKPGDKVVAYTGLTEEGLILHSKHKIETIGYPGSNDPDLKARLQGMFSGGGRVWMISFRGRNHVTMRTLLATPAWKELDPKRVFKKRGKQVRLEAYELKPAANPKATSSTLTLPGAAPVQRIPTN